MKGKIVRTEVKGTLLAFGIWLGLLALATIVSAAEGQSITRAFEVDAGGTLTLDTDRGSVEVLTTNHKTVTVEITRKVPFGGSKDILDDFVVEFEHSGKDVSIRGDLKQGWWGSWRNRLKVHYKITVPERYNLDVKTSGGRIRVADLEGEVRVKTSGGRLALGRIDGSVYGRTSGGRIELAGCTGSVDVKTSGGRIALGAVSGNVRAHSSGGSITIDAVGGEVKVSTSGGSIRIDEVKGAVEVSTSGGSITATIIGQPERDSSLETSGGSVTVYLADNIRANVDARSSGGGVSSELPITIQGRMDRQALRGTINGGGPELYIRSSGGPIRILGR